MEEIEWVPRTKLGKQVAAKEIKSIEEIFDKGLVIKEAEIVDALVPDLEEQVIAIGRAGRPFKMVQRMTDSGRRNNFQVIVTVGNKDGYVGLGEGRAKEYGPSLRKAIKAAKISLMRVPRGCGSWQCSCSATHSVPFRVKGHMGSVSIILKPAPKGIGLAASKTSKTILSLAGYSDIWVKSFGHTSARINQAKATFDALVNLSAMKAADLSKYYTKQNFAQEIESLRDAAPVGEKAKEKPQATAETPKAKPAEKPTEKPEVKSEGKPKQKPEKKPSKKKSLAKTKEEKTKAPKEKDGKPEKEKIKEEVKDADSDN